MHDQCSNLIFSAATYYDMKCSSSGIQSSRKIYITEPNNSNFYCDSISYFTEDNANYDMDASANTLLINMSNQIPNTFMPKKDFSALIPEVRKIWSKMPNDMKLVMLRSRTVNDNEGVNNHSKNSYKTTKSPSYLSRKFIKAYLHELLTKIISESSLSEKNEVDATVDDPDSESTLLANSASSNAMNLGDICKIISTPDKGKATYNKK